MASSQSNEFRGQSRPHTSGSQYNALEFAILQALSKVRTVALVKVVAVHGGGVAPVGTVDVQPMVNQIDGEGRAVAHGTIYGLPYFRLQYGSTAVIVDPVPGDIGMAAFADRDISAVKSTKKKSNPGSFRQHDMADGLYIGSFLGGAPDQYIRLHDGGIDVVSPHQVSVAAPDITMSAEQKVRVEAPVIELDGMLVQTTTKNGTGVATLVGPVNVENDVTAGTISLENHTHPGDSGGTTGSPNA